MGVINPYRKFVSSISPSDFEKFCLDILKAYAEAEALTDFSIIHNHKKKTSHGHYQMDIYAEFVALGVRIKVIVECKRYSRPVERKEVIVLADKIRSLGGNKGILISTSGFQSGAGEYAKKHGIALVQIFDKHIMHIQQSVRPILDSLHVEFINQLPKYYAYQWLDDFPDRRIYPSKAMMAAISVRLVDEFGIDNVMCND